MKEVHVIKNWEGREILAQIIEGKITMITDDNRSLNEKKAVGEEDREEWFSDNEDYIFAVYQVLKAVDAKGGFDHLKTPDDIAGCDAEKIYV